VSGVVRGPLKPEEIKNLVMHSLGAMVQNRAGVSDDVCLVINCSLALNNVCCPPSLSLPILKNVMNWMFRSYYFWKVDWKKEFWQLPIRRVDQYLFGYFWDDEFYCWQVVCFSWTNASV
jgi:hypothetical protein